MTETVTIEKQVWESTLHHSMVLQAENEQLKEKIERLEKQLKIAVEALELYKNLRGDGTLINYESIAKQALQQIKELENEKTPQSI